MKITFSNTKKSCTKKTLKKGKYEFHTSVRNVEWRVAVSGGKKGVEME